MTRDYAKKHSTKKSSKKQKKSSYLLLWLITLILFALFTLGLVYLGKHQREIRHQKKIIPKKIVIPKPVCNEPVKSAPIPKFDFYTLLPQKDHNAAVIYELDITTVKNYADADHIKAELSLLGIEANISSSKCGDQEVFRVMSGPYDNKDAALADQQRLKQNDIKCTLKKVIKNEEPKVKK